MTHHKEAPQAYSNCASNSHMVLQDQGGTLQVRLFFRAMPSQAALALRVGHSAVFAGVLPPPSAAVLPPPASAAHADSGVRSSSGHQHSIATWHEVACSTALYSSMFKSDEWHTMPPISDSLNADRYAALAMPNRCMKQCSPKALACTLLSLPISDPVQSRQRKLKSHVRTSNNSEQVKVVRAILTPNVKQILKRAQ